MLLAFLPLSTPAAVPPRPGTVDLTFDPKGGLHRDNIQSIYTIAVDRDGYIWIAGQFNTFDSERRNNLARLNPDGTLDRGFDPGARVNGHVHMIEFLDNGKVLLGGDLLGFGSATRVNLLILNADGSLDSDFVPQLRDTGFSWFSGARSVQFQSDGRMIVSGAFTSQSSAHSGTVRLNPDGSFDPSFMPVQMSWLARPFTLVSSIVVLPDQQILYSGIFDPFSPNPAGGLGRLSPDGVELPGFGVPDPALVSTGILVPQVTATQTNILAVLADPRVSRVNLLRANLQGQWDEAFQAPEEAGVDFAATPVVQPDGKIITKWMTGVARLMPDGEVDPSFEVTREVGAGNSRVWAMALQPDGRIIVAGIFDDFHGVKRNGIVRLHGDADVNSARVIPPSVDAPRGSSAILSVQSWLADPITYQWQFQGIDLPNATNRTLQIGPIHEEQLGSYGVQLTAQDGRILTATPSSVRFLDVPLVHAQPIDSSERAGGSSTMSIQAFSRSDLRIQWYRNGEPLAGQTGLYLTLDGLQEQDFGFYRAIVQNAAGITLTRWASLSVIPSPASSVTRSAPSQFISSQSVSGGASGSSDLAIARSSTGLKLIASTADRGGGRIEFSTDLNHWSTWKSFGPGIHAFVPTDDGSTWFFRLASSAK